MQGYLQVSGDKDERRRRKWSKEEEESRKLKL